MDKPPNFIVFNVYFGLCLIQWILFCTADKISRPEIEVKTLMMSPNLLKTDVSYTWTSAVDDKNISIHITCIHYWSDFKMCYLWGEKCHIHLVNITFQLSQIFFLLVCIWLLYTGKYLPLIFLLLLPLLTAGEFQCLKLSFLKHNFVCVNSKTATLFVSVEVWKLHGAKITLYTVVSKSVTRQLLLAY